MLRVLHICYLDSGGAGRATVRLHQALNNLGVNSKLLVLYKNTSESKVYKYEQKDKLLIRLLKKFGIKQTAKQKHKKCISEFKKTYFIYTSPKSDYKVDKHELVEWADIIHLHWVSGFVDYKSFFKSVSKPVVWTIHDKNPTLGGFHLLIDKKRNEKNPIINLEKAHSNYKRLAYKQHNNLTVVAPSKFLADYSSKSKLLGSFKHHHIYNSIDVNLFYPKNNKELRKSYEIENDKTVLLFMSEGLDHKHKGIHLLISALKKMDLSNTILITVGSGNVEGVENVISFGKVQDDNKLCELYSIADAVIIPSLEDNLPNVMLEAMACGTPVIGTPIGGMIDVIQDGITGIKSEGVEPVQIREAIETYLNTKDKFNSDVIRNYAVSNFIASKQASAYLKIYKSIKS